MKRVLTFGNQPNTADGTQKRVKPSGGRTASEDDLPRKRNDEYTVGWICAVITEYVAAQAVLDEPHARPETVSPATQSDYTLGRIGEHNVVIASLPFGEYGTASAATVAADMAHDFPNIKIRLMVGIGGGVPSKRHDVRLGDIVVSAPCNGHGGVVQYDFGKTVQGQCFQSTRYLDQPPMILRTAMSGLAAQYEHRGHRIEETITGILGKSLLMQKKFSRPHESSDRLYKSTSAHPLEGGADCELSCDDSSLVVRLPRTPGESLVIHYGLIASANQLMKDAIVRDQLSSQYDVLCFEMEAGGLMNQFPCLVIRGICDYSDSHKNKAWQGYAAMTAAAYAKDLINRVSPTDRSTLQSTNSMKSPDQPQASPEVPHTISAGQQRRLLASLQFDQIDARQMTIKKAHAKTCQWLLHKPEYLDWLDPAKIEEHRGFLWIKGKPGTGKSTLMKFALHNAQRRMKDKIIINFFFNARGEALEKSTIGMYRSLLLQLLEKIPALQNTVELPRSIAQTGEGYHWSTEILTDLLEQAIQNLEESSVVCFIDALDECEEDQVRDMVKFFEELGESTAAGAFRVCFSSRHYPHITISKGLDLVLEGQEGHTQDMVSYIDSELKIGNSRLANELRSELREKAAGVFMWIVLVVGLLNKEYDRGCVHQLRKRLQEIPGDLHALFRDILTRDRQNAHELLLCIQWVLFAKQPLQPQQLYFALLSNEVYEWKPDEMTVADMERFILNSSKGLTEVTKSNAPTVQFIHESVKDYLIKENGLKEIWPDLGATFVGESHEHLKQCCMSYIALGKAAYFTVMDLKLKSFSKEARAQRETANASFPFLQYAVKNVLHHASEAHGGGVDQVDFLGSFQLSDWVKLDNFFELHDRRRHNETVSIAYILAENNAAHLIQLLPASAFIIEESDRCGFPIFAALDVDSRESVRAILEAYMEIDPSFRAVVGDCMFYPNEMSQGGIRRSFEFHSHWALTELSSYSATWPVVLYLKVKRLGVGLDIYSRMALRTAVSFDRKDTVEYFLDNGAYPDDGNIQGLLSLAIRERSDTVAEYLLRIGAKFDPLDEADRSLFFAAAKGGLGSTLEMFIERGAEVHMRDEKGRTPLSCASPWRANRATVALLLSKGAEVDAKDLEGRTPLVYAAQWGGETTAALLLDKGAEINAKDNQGRTPLSCAASSYEGEALAALLLERGADIDAADNDGRTPLSHASNSGKVWVVKVLLDKGADIDAADNDGRTPLSYASSGGYTNVAKVLFDEGADIDAADNDGRTPLSYASSRGHTDVAIFLLHQGAKVDVED
ncbi:ankyrin [Trichoderma novae-zelandiae]